MSLDTFLDSTHEVYDANRDLWLRNERRLRGGMEVIRHELERFDWEKKGGDHFDGRVRQATYVNFPRRMASTLVGQVASNAPEPDVGMTFGTLGEVDEGDDVPSPATMLWRNVDAKGEASSQWRQWWSDVQERAMSTGHRWVLVEAPATDPTGRTVEDEIRGERPYAVEYSPLDVPNWQWSTNGLDWIIIALHDTSAFVENGEFKQSGRRQYYVHFRQGYSDLDALAPNGTPPFSAGGWWKFDDEGDVIDDGRYDATNGQIPVTPLFYRKADEGRSGVQRESKVYIEDRQDEARLRPRMSHPGLTEIGQIAVSYMNLGSSGDHDAHEGGSRTVYLVGIGPGDHEKVVKQNEKGSRIIGVPSDSRGEKPEIHDMAAASASEAIEQRQDRKMKEARLTARDEFSFAPGDSGESKKAEFRQTRKPILVLAAENREEAEQNAIRFFEQRWDRSVNQPEGSVNWSQDFDLEQLISEIERVFTIVRKSGGRSPLLAGRLIRAAVRDAGLDSMFDEDEIDEVVGQIESSVERQEQATDAVLGPGPTPTPSGNGEE